MSTDSPFVAPMEFKGDGFVIRAHQPGDGAAVRAASIASYEHLRPWMTWAKPDVSLEESEQLCRHSLARYLVEQDFGLGIWDGEEVLGGTAFHLTFGPRGLGVAETGMWISQSHAGKGLGTRVLNAMVEWGFTAWGWRRIVWKCDVRNVASARVAEKCGFRREATFRSDALTPAGDRRDTHLFAILADEWRMSSAR